MSSSASLLQEGERRHPEEVGGGGEAITAAVRKEGEGKKKIICVLASRQ